MKKILVLLVMGSFILSMSACGDNLENRIRTNTTVETGSLFDVEKKIKEQIQETITESKSTEYSLERLYYNKGEYDGRIYENVWADISFKKPQGFYNASEETYHSVENKNNECGLYFLTKDIQNIIYVCFEKLPISPVYDEKMYLDSGMNYMKTITKITYTVPDSYSIMEIGGYMNILVRQSRQSCVARAKITQLHVHESRMWDEKRQRRLC